MRVLVVEDEPDPRRTLDSASRESVYAAGEASLARRRPPVSIDADAADANRPRVGSAPRRAADHPRARFAPDEASLPPG